MLRPNEIKEKTFEQVGDGVYSAKEVDAFLNEISSSYEQVFKQNGELVRRLSLLANRLEAFRRQEETAKKASENKGEEVSDEAIKDKLEQAKAVAQKMLDDARTKAIGIVNNANNESNRILVDLNDKIREQRIALELLNSKSDSFKKQLLDIYRQHLISIDQIPSEAEKIVKDSSVENGNSLKKELPEYKIDKDDSRIFEQADNFVTKLEEEKKEKELIASYAEAENNTSESAEEQTNNVFSDAPVASDIPQEAAEEVAQTDSVKSPEGFVFDFSAVSFDDDDDDDDDEEDDTVQSASAETDDDISDLFNDEPEVSSDDSVADNNEEEKLDELFSSEKEDSDEFVIRDDLTFDDDDDDEDDEIESEVTSSSEGISFKDLVKSKGFIEPENDVNDDILKDDLSSSDEIKSNDDYLADEQDY